MSGIEVLRCGMDASHNGKLRLRRLTLDFNRRMHLVFRFYKIMWLQLPAYVILATEHKVLAKIWLAGLCMQVPVRCSHISMQDASED